MNKPTVNKTKQELYLSAENAWLDLDFDNLDLGSPFKHIYSKDPLLLATNYIEILSKKENIHYFVKKILNVDLLPIQAAIIREFWVRPFPMYLASRGFGKALTPKSLVRIKNGWVEIEKLKPGDKVYGGDGNLCNVINISGILENLDFYKLTLKDGREIECCKDHQWKVYDKLKNAFKVVKTEDIFNQMNNFSIPINEKLKEETIEIDFGINKDRANGVYNKEYLNENNTIDIVSIKYIGKKNGCCIMVDSPDHTYITKDYIVTHNSFLLALYVIIKALLKPGSRIVVTGAGFRQSKIIFEYIERIYSNAPVFRDICGPNGGTFKEADRWKFKIGQSLVTALPVGTGDKIRGQRANIIVVDEFASMSPQIYETVISGFASVSDDPVKNVKEAAKRQKLIEYGVWTEDHEVIFNAKSHNQSIISGTASYDFEHFADYWKRYKAIIESRGDPEKLKAINGNDDSKKLNWRDYSIIRIPYDLIPAGFMDDKHIARAKATVHSGVFANEYGAVFSKDSEGFFKRTLIESCVAKDTSVRFWNIPYCVNPFDPLVHGDMNCKYIYGIDPASESDNFSLVILEAHPEHARLVYCWTTTKHKMRKIMDAEENYYKYCARKIRTLMGIFPCQRIGIDTQGGGYALMEALHDKDSLHDGELMIWPIIDPDKESPTDYKSGLHIIEPINFSSAEWVSNANHGLRKDMESKTLLFPRYDGLQLSLAAESDMERGVDKNPAIDSMENCIYEIEELKNELCTIVMSQTEGGRDKWGLPEFKAINKKNRPRKDRYSALLIANMLARQANRSDPVTFTYSGMGYAGDVVKKEKSSNLYSSEWYKIQPKVIRR